MHSTNTQIGRFIGPNKIADFQILAVQTPLGSHIFEVTYENGAKELFPEKGFAAVVSDDLKDYAHIRDARLDLLVPAVIDLMQEYDLPLEQFTHFMTTVTMEVKNRFHRASAILWHGTKDRYIPGIDPMDSLSLLEALRVNATQE